MPPASRFEIEYIEPRARASVRACVMFALPQELKPFLKVKINSVEARHTGAGSANAANVTRTTLAKYTGTKPLVIICGFGGALTSALKPGDLCVSKSIIDASGGSGSATTNLSADSIHTSIAAAQKITSCTVHSTSLVTADRVLISSANKREYHRRFGASVVDMETAAAAKEAEIVGAPWISIRAITDSVDDDMPLDFNLLTGDDGCVSLPKVIFATLIRPWSIPGMMRLGKSSSLAGRNLAIFLETFVRRLPINDETAVAGD